MVDDNISLANYAITSIEAKIENQKCKIQDWKYSAMCGCV